MDEKGLKMRKKRLLGILLVLALSASIFLPLLAADAQAGPKEVFDEINKFFKDDQGYKEYSNIIDFMIFFVIFFSVAFLGFSKWFGEGFGKAGSAKGAVVGLSVAFGLALSLGLVLSGKFKLTDFAPIAKNVIFIVLALMFYGILSSDGLIGKDTITKKIISAMLAVAIAYVAMNFLTWGVCLAETNNEHPACTGGIFTAASKGYDYVFGDGTGGAGGPGTGRTGIGTGTGTGKPLAWSEGRCVGGLRLDGTFSSGSSKPKSEKIIKDFVKAVQQRNGGTIRVYTFPPEGGDKLEAEVRADVVGKIVESVGGTAVDAAQTGFFNVVDAGHNDRFILATGTVPANMFMPEQMTLNTRTECTGQEKSVTPTDCQGLDESQLNDRYVNRELERISGSARVAEDNLIKITKELEDGPDEDELADIRSRIDSIQGDLVSHEGKLEDLDKITRCADLKTKPEDLEDLKDKYAFLIRKSDELKSWTPGEPTPSVYGYPEGKKEEESGGLGVFGWGGIVLAILGIAALLFYYFKKKKEGLDGLSPDEIKRRLEEILKLATEKLRHINHWMDMKAGGQLPPDEKNIWADAANTDGISFLEIRESAIDRKIKKQVEGALLTATNPDGSHKFRNGISDEDRNMLINSLHGLIFNLILADRLLDKWYGKIMLDKKKMIERMDERNAKVLVSPFIQEGKVMFIFNSTLQTANTGDATDVKVKYEHTESHINVKETKDMLPMDTNKTVWTFQTPSTLTPGKYKYQFIVMRKQTHGTDKKCNERDMQNPLQASKTFSEFEIEGTVPPAPQNPPAGGNP